MSEATAIRIEVLTQLYGERPGSRDVPHIVRLARRDDVATFHALSEFAVSRELDFLRGLGQVERVPNLDRWRITAAGIQWLEEQGLVYMGTPRGKIGRLPVALRDRVNAMIRDSKTAEEIIAFCTSNGAENVTPQNISAWKNWGYERWERRMEKIDTMRNRVEFAGQLAAGMAESGAAGLASDAASALAVDAISAALEDFNPESLKVMVAERPEKFADLVLALSRIRQRDQAGVLMQMKVDEYKRKVAQLMAVVDQQGAASAEDVKSIFKEAYGI